MILLDHIPHNDMANPIENVESSYSQYRISIYIPDINCPRCTLQLLYINTDKTIHCGIQSCFYNPDDSACKGPTQVATPTCPGAPNDNPCRLDNQCFLNCKSNLFIFVLVHMYFSKHFLNVEFLMYRSQLYRYHNTRC